MYAQGEDELADFLVLSSPSDVAVMQISRKLEALTLHHVMYKIVPAPEMLASLTQLSITAGAKSFFRGATAE